MIPGLLLAYAGLSALCFSTERHGSCVWRRLSDRRLMMTMRILGSGLLAASFVACFASGRSAGIVAWFGLISVTGLVLICLLPYAPRMLGTLGLVATASSATLLMLSH